MTRPSTVALLTGALALSLGACGDRKFVPARFAGAWAGTCSMVPSGLRLAPVVEVTHDDRQLHIRLDLPGGRPETFTMEIVDDLATLAETRSARYGEVQGSLDVDGRLRVTGRAATGLLDSFELRGEWTANELTGEVSVTLDSGQSGTGQLRMQRR